MAANEVERLVRVLHHGELDVRLVEDHGDVARQVRHECADVLHGERRRGRVVRVADEDDPRGVRDLARHRLQVVPAGPVERHGDRAGARHRREVRVDRERRPRVDDLGAWLEHRLGRREQDLARPVADRDSLRREVAALGEPAAQHRRGRVRVAVEVRQLLRHGRAHGVVRPPRRLVRGQHRQVAVVAVALGRRVHRDLADSAGELDAGHCAPCRSVRSETASRRYTCFAGRDSSA